jgi:hypothetical protein
VSKPGKYLFSQMHCLKKNWSMNNAGINIRKEYAALPPYTLIQYPQFTAVRKNVEIEEIKGS